MGRSAVLRAIVMAGVVSVGLGVAGAAARTPAPTSVPNDTGTSPATADALFDRADAMIGVERFGRALALLKQVTVQTDDQALRMDMALGRIFLGVGRPARALDFFQKAAMETMADAPALAAQAQCELILGRLADARRDAKDALRSDGNTLAAQVVLAKIDARVGRRAQAEKRLADLARNLPDSAAVAVARARFTASYDRYGAAVQLERFVHAHPFAASAEDALGQILWDLGRAKPALAHRRHAAQLFADKGDTARAQAIRAWIKAASTLPGVVEAERRNPHPAPLASSPPVTEDQRQPSPPLPAPQVSVTRISTDLPPIDANRPPGGAGAAMATPFPFSPKGWGSGIVLQDGRWVLTNRHVVRDGTRFAARNGLGQMEPATVYAVDRAADLALLKLAAPFPDEDGFPLSRIIAPATGARVVVMGYPIPYLMGDNTPSLTEGIVSKAMGLQDDPTEFQMTARIEPGNSGGPVFDRHGDLIGVSVATVNIDPLRAAHLGGMDASLGVSARSIARFLKISIGRAPTVARRIDPERFYQRELREVVLIAFH